MNAALDSPLLDRSNEAPPNPTPFMAYGDRQLTEVAVKLSSEVRTQTCSCHADDDSTFFGDPSGMVMIKARQ